MIKTCLEYHQKTSYDRVEMSGHTLDWANQPKVFKEYPGITSLPLPRDLQIPKAKLSAILKEPEVRTLTGELGIKTLSLLFLLSYTHTASARHAGGNFYFRSAASAGALYPTEIYVATHEIIGVDNGLYHFSIQNHSLDLLRSGNIPGVGQGREGALMFFLTAVFFRSAWKYRARAYRYHLLDTGHVAENLALALKTLGLSFRLTYDFEDEKVNRLLGIDDQKEAALAIVEVPGAGGSRPERPEAILPLAEAVKRAGLVSEGKIDYPAIREIHEAGMHRAESVEESVGTEKGMVHELGFTPKPWTGLESDQPWPEILDYPDAVFRRRSRRNFVGKALSKQSMTALLLSLCPHDGSPGDQSVAVGFLVGNVQGMDPGFYLLDRCHSSWAPVFSVGVLGKSASVCLDQTWLSNAGAHVLFLADLEGIEKTWGPRGYRYAMLTAGGLGQRLYIAAETLGIGCCGIGAFYDAEAVQMLGLNQRSRLLYLVAVGNVRRA